MDARRFSRSPACVRGAAHRGIFTEPPKPSKKISVLSRPTRARRADMVTPSRHIIHKRNRTEESCSPKQETWQERESAPSSRTKGAPQEAPRARKAARAKGRARSGEASGRGTPRLTPSPAARACASSASHRRATRTFRRGRGRGSHASREARRRARRRWAPLSRSAPWPWPRPPAP